MGSGRRKLAMASRKRFLQASFRLPRWKTRWSFDHASPPQELQAGVVSLDGLCFNPNPPGRFPFAAKPAP